jgi:DNA-directed RNA polymerase specialized sigma24 family protein
MSDDGSITAWLGRLTDGDRLAAEQLWRRYFDRLVALARARLRDAPRRVADEEDVALSAFDSFCRAAAAGRFPDLADRDSLWAVLLTITARKAFRLMRDQQRQKRGGQWTRAAEDAAWHEALSREPDPALAAEVTETFHCLLDRLNDAELRSVAVWKMEGCGVEEVARRLNYSPRTVKRMTRLIRDIWEQEVEP